MSKIKAVVFDLNGIFIRGRYLSVRIKEEFGVDEKKFLAALKKVMPIVRKPNISDSFSIWQPYLDELGLKISKKEFFDFWFSGEEVDHRMIDLVRELKERGVKVFILSNNFKERTEYYRSHFPGIFETVDQAYFSWENGFVKPSPEAFANLLKEHNLKPEECIYFDDQKENVLEAQDLGIDSQIFESFEKAQRYIKKYLSQAIFS